MTEKQGPRVQEDSCFDEAIFAVEEAHIILYCGRSFHAAARKVAMSSGTIVSVWMAGQHMGDTDVEGFWRYKTMYGELACRQERKK